MTQIRILFISWTVPPIGGSHGRRVKYFLKYASRSASRLDVLTIMPTSNYPFFDESSLNSIPKHINIYRIDPGFITNHFYRQRYKYLISEKSNSRWTNIKSFLISKLRYFIIETNALWLVDWTLPAIRKGAKLIREHDYNIMISSGNAEAHIIAYMIKLLNNNVSWIADYGDPWVFSPSYRASHTKVKLFIDKRLEKRILKSASIITVTSDETKTNYLVNYSFLDGEKVKVIPMGTDYELFNGIHAKSSDKFRILYTGSIYPHQDINPFFDAVQLINSNETLRERIEFLFVGDLDKKYIDIVENLGIGGMITFSKFVPYESSLSLIIGADVLLSFGSKGGLQIPGKLFDLICSKKPILWIKGDDVDPALRYLVGLNSAIIVENNCKSIFLNIMNLYELYTKNELNLKYYIDKMPEISWENRVESLIDMCKILTKNQKV